MMYEILGFIRYLIFNLSTKQGSFVFGSCTQLSNWFCEDTRSSLFAVHVLKVLLNLAKRISLTRMCEIPLKNKNKSKNKKTKRRNYRIFFFCIFSNFDIDYLNDNDVDFQFSMH